MVSYFTKTNATYLTTWTYDGKYWKNITTLYPLDTLGSYALRKSYNETTGGLAFTHSSRIMWMDAPSASSTRSIDIHQTRRYNRLRKKIPTHFP